MENIKSKLIMVTKSPNDISNIEVLNSYGEMKKFTQPFVYDNEKTVKEIIINQFILFYKNSFGSMQDFGVSLDELEDLNEDTLLEWLEEIMTTD